MPAPFNSAAFFADPFFTQPKDGDSGIGTYRRMTGATVTNTLYIPMVYRHGLDPQRDGALIQRGGHWAEITMLVSDFENGNAEGAGLGANAEPKAHDEIELDGETFDLESHSKDGDIITCKCLAKQRMKV